MGGGGGGGRVGRREGGREGRVNEGSVLDHNPELWSSEAFLLGEGSAAGCGPPFLSHQTGRLSSEMLAHVRFLDLCDL